MYGFFSCVLHDLQSCLSLYHYRIIHVGDLHHYWYLGEGGLGVSVFMCGGGVRGLGIWRLLGVWRFGGLGV